MIQSSELEGRNNGLEHQGLEAGEHTVGEGGSGGYEWAPIHGAGGARWRWDGLLTSQNVVSLCEEARI